MRAPLFLTLKRAVLLPVLIASWSGMSAQQVDSMITVDAAGDTTVHFYYPTSPHADLTLEEFKASRSTETMHAVPIQVSRKQRIQTLAQQFSVIPLSNYLVGEIPYEESIAPSGARLVSIPVRTAAGTPVPDVKFVYNSQSGEGVAGYGWEIGGISSISVVPKSICYDGISDAATTGADAAFALDGVRLVANHNTAMPDYQYVTAQGNIYVKRFLKTGSVSYFLVAYPDGSKGTFGYVSNNQDQTSYPLISKVYRSGFRVDYEYTLDNDIYYVSRIRYGGTSLSSHQGEVVFTYVSRSKYVDRYYAGKRGRLGRILKQVDSRNDGELLFRYTLTHIDRDGEPMMAALGCATTSGSFCPLQFTYGEDASSPILNQELAAWITTSFSENKVLRRGKFIKGDYGDGLVIYPEKEIHEIRQKKRDGWFGPFARLFGSSYEEKDSIYVIPHLHKYLSQNASKSLSMTPLKVKAGSGFQTIEVVDVDGDGIDELVHVSWGEVSSDHAKVHLNVIIYSVSETSISEKKRFSVQLTGIINSRNIFWSPMCRTYQFGDFRGDGKAMLAIFVHSQNKWGYKLSNNETAGIELVDLNAGTLVSRSALSDFPYDEGAFLQTGDYLGSGRSTIGHLAETSLDIYGLQGSQFVIEQSLTVSEGTRSGVYRFGDLNGDGLTDMLVAPSTGSTWTYCINTGTDFQKQSVFCPFDRTGSFLLIDMDADGLLDLVRVKDNEMKVYLNRFGRISSSASGGTISVSSSSLLFPLNVVNGRQASTLVTLEGNKIRSVNLSPGTREHQLLTLMQDSYGNRRYTAYSDMTSSDICVTGESQRQYPYSEVRFHLPIVGASTILSGMDQEMVSDVTYSYGGPVIHRKGLGFSGFERIETEDLVQGVVRLENYDPTRLGVMIQSSTRLSSSSSPYQSVSYSYTGAMDSDGKYNPRMISRTEKDLLKETCKAVSYAYDKYGFIINETTYWRRLSNTIEASVFCERTYAHQTGSTFLLGLMTEESNIHFDISADPLAAWKERTSITYSTDFYPVCEKYYVGKVHTSYDAWLSVWDGVEHKVSETRRTYDIYGHVLTEKTAPYDAETFVGKNYEYSSDGRYRVRQTDAAGISDTYADFNALGQPRARYDHAGRMTSYEYDGLGRSIHEIQPDGLERWTIYEWGGSGLYKVTEEGTDGVSSRTHYDALSRMVRQENLRFDGQWASVEIQYDDKGRISRESRPHRQAAAAGWTIYGYDDFGRQISMISPSGRTRTWNYQGLSVTESRDGVSVKRTEDVLGRIVSTEDEGGCVTTTYDGSGNIVRVTAPGDVVTSFSYDVYGNRYEINDPSAGIQRDTVVYAADATSYHLHENPKGNVITRFDALGRITKVERSGSFQTNYTYNDLSQVLSEVSSNGTQKNYEYDELDRLSVVRETAPDGKWLERSYTYDSQGRVSAIAYTTQEGPITTENYSYVNGWNDQISLPDGTTIWKLTGENDWGQCASALTGGMQRLYDYDENGFPARRRMGSVMDFRYQFDTQTGNLRMRTDAKRQKNEMFGYDNLNRLTSIGARQILYADNGNILSMGDMGTMAYENESHPYQITSMIPVSGGSSYKMQEVEYSSSLRPVSISEGGYRGEILYDADDERVRMRLFSGDTLVGVRYYLAGCYEREETLANTEERLYLGGDYYSAPMVYVRENGEVWSLYNIGRDYLGSVTHIATSAGDLVAEYSYDAWGNLRDPATWECYTDTECPDLFLGRGYTGHEHLSWCGLVNMNARLYDPVVGRFLSPDPYVQNPEFSQNFNRYSYALDNPLKYSDVDGEWLTWRITGSGFQIGVNFGFWGFGLCLSWGDKDVKVGAYVEAGFRMGGDGFLKFASTAEQRFEYSLANGTVSYTTKVGVEGSAGFLTADASVSYNWNHGGGGFSGGTLTASGSLTAGISSAFSGNASYVYTKNYASQVESNTYSMGLSWKTKIQGDGSGDSTDLRLTPQFSHVEKTGEKAKNTVNLFFALAGQKNGRAMKSKRRGDGGETLLAMAYRREIGQVYGAENQPLFQHMKVKSGGVGGIDLLKLEQLAWDRYRNKHKIVFGEVK